jgi:hypothetical protein
MTELLHRDAPTTTSPYFVVQQLPDGRYAVELIKEGSKPRRSVAPHIDEVMKQLVRAGRLPVQTDCADLRRACREHEIELR